MDSILESVSWGRPALNLLKQCRELDLHRPAVMHVRHTERPAIFKGSNLLMLSTSNGKIAAAEFGAALPKDRQYRLFHTNVERVWETAEEMYNGIVRAGGKAEISGKIQCEPVLDWEAFLKWTQSRKWFPEDGAYNSTCEWIAGLRPNKILKPSTEFAQEMAKNTKSNPEPLREKG